MSRVRILNVFQIPLPTPPPRDTITLSFLDTLWIGLPPVKLLLFYSDATIPFSSIVESLKSSLSRTLPLFYPFAGKLTHIPSTGAISIDCSTDATGGGVTFIEAEADGEIHRLGGGGEQDLLPVLDARELPAPVLAVQVTRLEGKGLALGFAVHHAVVDGKAVWKFLEAWAAACRRGGDAPLACSVAAHDREVIRHRRGDEIARRFVQQLAPALPIVNTTIEGRLSRLARRTFVISPASIQALKDEAMRQRNDGATTSQGPPHPPSTFVSVSAHAWIHFLRAKNVMPDDNSQLDMTSLCFLVDCRRHLDPPPGEEYLGNCVVGCEARTKTSEILSKGGFALACSVIQRAIEERVRDPLRGCENWAEEMMKARAMARMVNIVASPRFKVYEVSDFGWGRPCKVELLPMNDHEGEIVLFGAREEGGVQVSLALDPSCMDAFASNFTQGFGP